MFIGVHLWFLAFSANAAPVAIVDDLGRHVELKAPARRIVTLAPFLTELAYAAGAGDRLVGASEYSDYPPAALRLPHVSNAMGVAVEAVAALRPDVALAWKDSVRPAEIEQLARLGIPTVVVAARRVADVPRALAQVAAVAGLDASAKGRAFEARIAQLRARYAGRPRLPVLLEVWHRPLTTISGPHTMNEALATCGAENVFADLPGVAPVVPWEEVYRRDPVAIVGAGSRDGEAEFRANWASRNTLRAVREKRLVFADADTLQRPGLRLVEGIAMLCEALEAVRPR